MFMHRKAQSTMEFTVLIIIIIAAFIATQNYIKRGFQGRIKSSMDDFGEQYDPRYTNSFMNYSLVSNADTSVQIIPSIDPQGNPGYTTNRIDTTVSVETRQGTSAVGDP